MRERILAAAVTVMREHGVKGTTTKQIARVAGVAEGSIYNHFPNKSVLIGASMSEVAGGIRDALTKLSLRIGAGTVEDNLTELAEAEIAFFLELLPITGSVLGDHGLREWLRRGGPKGRLHGDPPHGIPAGPVLGHAPLIAYLEAEQRAGRLPEAVRPAYLASALIGACQQYAFLTLLTLPEIMADVAGLPADAGEYAREVVRAILP